MNRLVSRNSICYIAVAWILALALSADGVNLDDLCAGALVLHDDDEVALPTAVSLAGWTDPGTAQHNAEHRSSHEGKRTTKPSPAAPTRVIVDQDSPSLAAESTADLLSVALIFSGPPQPRTLDTRSGDLLYLRFCTLLI